MLRETIGLENSLADNLQEAKTYADKIKSDLLGSAGESYDTFKEIEEYLKDHAEALQFMDSVTRKFVTTVGDGVALEHTITHNLLSRDVVVTLRETKAPYEMVLADVAFTDENTIKIITALPLAKDELTVTAVG